MWIKKLESAKMFSWENMKFVITPPNFSVYYGVLLASQYDGIDIYPDDYVLDAGANIGLFTVPAAKKAQKVIAVEPLRANFELLKRNIKINRLDNVILIRKALSDENGIGFIKGVGGHAKLSDKGQLVETIRIDSLLDELGVDKIDVLKMDIEGGELRALKSEKFLKNVREIAMETHGKKVKLKIIKLLHKHGFLVENRVFSYKKLVQNILKNLPNVIEAEIKSSFVGLKEFRIRCSIGHSASNIIFARKIS